MTWLQSRIKDVQDDKLDLYDLLDEIKNEKLGGRWAGVIMLNLAKEKFVVQPIYFEFQGLSKHLINSAFSNSYFMYVPGSVDRKGKSYKELVDEWTNKFIKSIYENGARFSDKVRKDIAINRNNGKTGGFWCEDIQILEIFLFWKIWKVNAWVEMLPLEEVLKKACNEAARLFKKFGEYFIINCNGKDSEEHIEFEEIFALTSGTPYEYEYESDDICILSGVMK